MSNPAKEPSELLCMLSFTDHGTIRWKRGIGNAPDNFVQRIVRVCRASVSITSAFLSITDDMDEFPSSDVQRSDARTKEEPIIVQCEKDTVILAKQIRNSPDKWFALIARPCVLPSNIACHGAITALEDLSKILSPTTRGDHEDLYEFCDWMCKSLTSSFFWNDKGRITHFMDSLVKLCAKKSAQSEEISQGQLKHSENSYQSLQATLAQLLVPFHTELYRQFGASRVKLCLFRADRKPLYAENLDRREIDLIGWYFLTFLNLGLAAWSNVFSHCDKWGTLHAWYTHRGLILFTSFLCTKGESEDPARSLRDAAVTLMAAASRAIVK